jgi:hypothetical protein
MNLRFLNLRSLEIFYKILDCSFASFDEEMYKILTIEI